MYENIVSSFENSKIEIQSIKDLYALGSEEKNEEVLIDCNKKIDNIYNLIKKNEINCFLSGENDRLNIYLEMCSFSSYL